MDDMTRRDGVKLIAAASAAAALGACARPSQGEEAKMQPAAKTTPAVDPVQAIVPLDRVPWPTRDPFLFCVHHKDAYPRGTEQFGPATSLAGRRMGMDFANKDGWNMYHGQVVPGFPSHPHRGFETVTVVRDGLIDHSDSLGAAARYGDGDVQWLTAGRGIQHAEMFPLLKRDADNPAELFQIWLNLPKANKMVEPYFSMLWSDTIPRVEHVDAAGRVTRLTIVAGAYGDRKPPAPPPDSWASQAQSDLAIWTLQMAPGATWTAPKARAGTQRSFYFFAGASLGVSGRSVAPGNRVDVMPDQEVVLEAGPEPVEILMLQGRPIGEPVAQHGPFVMNTQAEIRQAYADFRRTRFGGWPWPSSDPVHGREGRFAKRPDGSVERPA